MTHIVAPPFAHSSGPQSARIAFVGEAWGADEERVGLPFVGNAGMEFNRLLAESGHKRGEAFLTNVFAARPPDNKLPEWCVPKGTALEIDPTYALPPLSQGKYIHPQFAPELDRLREELNTVRPNLIVCLGGTALWALSSAANIGAMRGTAFYTPFLPMQKCLATFHPSYIFKVWPMRPIVLADLIKARAEMDFPEIRRPEREIMIATSLDEIEWWFKQYAEFAPIIACDVETERGQIKCIGFASSRRHALVITFIDPKHPTGSFWPTPSDELAAWNWVERILQLPCKKLFQNGLYDVQYIWKVGIAIANMSEDTMLLHHSIYPEMRKGLGFLGSIYSNEPAWKLMRLKREELKRDE